MLIPPKLCGYCQQEFQPKYTRARFCSRRHGALWASEHRRGKATANAARARHVQAVDRLLARLNHDLGPLTDRDYRLIALVARDAYQRGYTAAYHKQFPRTKTA